MLRLDPIVVHGSNGILSGVDEAVGVLVVAAEDGEARGVHLTYEEAANLAHYLIRLYNIHKKDEAFHGETPEPSLPRVTQLQLTDDELKYISNAVHFRQSFVNREAGELVMVNQICRQSTLELDAAKFNAFADKLNTVCLTLFPEQCL